MKKHTNVELGVARAGFCIAIDGIFSFLANRSQGYYTLNSILINDTFIDDFALSHALIPTVLQLSAAGQSEVFSDAMNVVTNALLINYNGGIDPNVAFTAPWFRFSERAHNILVAPQLAQLNIKRMVIRHLWIIKSLVAVFGRYYTPN